MSQVVDDDDIISLDIDSARSSLNFSIYFCGIVAASHLMIMFASSIEENFSV